MPQITITFTVCDIEPFLYQATPQMDAEDGAGASQINEQHLEGFLERLRAAVCADVQALLAEVNTIEARVTALE